MELFQYMVLIFSIFVISRVFLRLKDKELSINEFIFWIILWVGVIFVVLLPEFLGDVALLLGIGRPVDVLIYSTIILLMYLVFRIYIKLDNLEQEISQLVRHISIEEKKNEKKR